MTPMHPHAHISPLICVRAPKLVPSMLGACVQMQEVVQSLTQSGLVG